MIENVRKEFGIFGKLIVMNTTNYKPLILPAAGYTILLVLVGLFVFISNNGSEPLENIFGINNLIPVLIYSAGTVWLCLGLNILMQKVLNRYLSFILSIVIGIPLGLLMVEKLFILIF